MKNMRTSKLAWEQRETMKELEKEAVYMYIVECLMIMRTKFSILAGLLQ